MTKLLLAGVIVLSWGARARAEVPREIGIEIEASERDGAPLEGEHRVNVRLYAGGLALHASAETAHAARGTLVVLFEVPEGALEHADLEVGLAIDGDPEMRPRIPIVSVPFALRADRADRAESADRATECVHAESASRVDGLDPAILQPRISGACAPGESISAIAPDGSVACEPDDVGPSYAPGWGTLLADGRFAVDASQVQRRVAGSCPAGWAIRAIDASGYVTCERIAQPRVEASFVAARSGRYGTTAVTLGSAASRACFLSQVGLRELDVAEDRGECVVRQSAGQWVLEAILGADPASGRDTDALVSCRAQCVSW